MDEKGIVDTLRIACSDDTAHIAIMPDKLIGTVNVTLNVKVYVTWNRGAALETSYVVGDGM